MSRSQGSYDGMPGKFMIDTGARQTLMLNTPFVAKNNLHNASVKGGEAVTGWGVGGPTTAFVIHGGLLKIGDCRCRGPLVLLSTDKGGANAERQLAGNIGGGILKRFVVTFDYEHNTMYLKPVAGTVADLDTFDRAGMWFNKDTEGYKVVDVTAKTPGRRSGSRQGRHHHRGGRQAGDGHPAPRHAHAPSQRSAGHGRDVRGQRQGRCEGQIARSGMNACDGAAPVAPS